MKKMIATIVLLFQSRKFYVGMLTILAVIASVALVMFGKVDISALVPTISAITTVGIASIGAIAWEDTTKAKANAQINASTAQSEGVSAAIGGIAGLARAITQPELDDNKAVVEMCDACKAKVSK